MIKRTRIDAAGRIVIPKKLRDRYVMSEGQVVRIIPIPDGISVVAEQRTHRFVKIGPILAIDTGVDSARIEDFDVDRIRDEHLETKQS